MSHNIDSSLGRCNTRILYKNADNSTAPSPEAVFLLFCSRNGPLPYHCKVIYSWNVLCYMYFLEKEIAANIMMCF